MEQSASWDANRFAASQEITPTLWNTEVLYHMYKSPLPVPILSQINPVHVPIPIPEDPSQYYPPIYFWVLQVFSFPQVSPPKPCIHLFSPHTYYMSRSSHSSCFDHPNKVLQTHL